jgi:hypothetical protein
MIMPWLSRVRDIASLRAYRPRTGRCACATSAQEEIDIAGCPDQGSVHNQLSTRRQGGHPAQAAQVTGGRAGSKVEGGETQIYQRGDTHAFAAHPSQ